MFYGIAEPFFSIRNVENNGKSNELSRVARHIPAWSSATDGVDEISRMPSL